MLLIKIQYDAIQKNQPLPFVCFEEKKCSVPKLGFRFPIVSCAIERADAKKRTAPRT